MRPNLLHAPGFLNDVTRAGWAWVKPCYVHALSCSCMCVCLCRRYMPLSSRQLSAAKEPTSRSPMRGPLTQTEPTELVTTTACLDMGFTWIRGGLVWAFLPKFSHWNNKINISDDSAMTVMSHAEYTSNSTHVHSVSMALRIRSHLGADHMVAALVLLNRLVAWTAKTLAKRTSCHSRPTKGAFCKMQCWVMLSCNYQEKRKTTASGYIWIHKHTEQHLPANVQLL